MPRTLGSMNPADFLVHLTLQAFSKPPDRSESRASNAAIAAATGLTVRGVRSALVRLERAHLVRRLSHRGRRVILIFHNRDMKQGWLPFEVWSNVSSLENLTLHERAVLVSLALVANKKGQVRAPSLVRLVAGGPRQLRRHRAALELKGYIKRHPDGSATVRSAVATAITHRTPSISESAQQATNECGLAAIRGMLGIEGEARPAGEGNLDAHKDFVDFVGERGRSEATGA